jgi:hypothetical protein
VISWFKISFKCNLYRYNEGQGEPDLVLKGRNRDEPVCRPIKVKSQGGEATDSGDLSALVGSNLEVMLPRPSVQSPLRDALHAFISGGGGGDRAASVVVIQGGGGCGKSILVDQLAAKVVGAVHVKSSCPIS